MAGLVAPGLGAPPVGPPPRRRRLRRRAGSPGAAASAPPCGLSAEDRGAGVEGGRAGLVAGRAPAGERLRLPPDERFGAPPPPERGPPERGAPEREPPERGPPERGPPLRDEGCLGARSRHSAGGGAVTAAKSWLSIAARGIWWPMYCSMSGSEIAYSSQPKLIASPSAPARAVRPMRWT